MVLFYVTSLDSWLMQYFKYIPYLGNPNEKQFFSPFPCANLLCRRIRFVLLGYPPLYGKYQQSSIGILPFVISELCRTVLILHVFHSNIARTRIFCLGRLVIGTCLFFSRFRFYFPQYCFFLPAQVFWTGWVAGKQFTKWENLNTWPFLNIWSWWFHKTNYDKLYFCHFEIIVPWWHFENLVSWWHFENLVPWCQISRFDFLSKLSTTLAAIEVQK